MATGRRAARRKSRARAELTYRAVIAGLDPAIPINTARLHYPNRNKCRKHGVSVAEIESLFGGEPLVGPDPKHSDSEERFRAIGLTVEGRHLFVVFTWRQQGELRLIRPISARYKHRKEIEAHEKEIP
jgi:uncharacterized protein